jgi:hypothetical protein
MNVKGKIIAQNAYYKQEFISSTDMNFRPVNSYTGPDGQLYIVDMHRGIIQQGNWTRPGSFLRNAIDRMGFGKNIGRGRIYRVVHDGYKSGKQPNMLNETPSQLVAHLSHPNGWWRDNAQKQLIVLGDLAVVPALKQIVNKNQESLNSESSHLERIHALWTLEGLDAIDEEILLTAFEDPHAQVRRAAIWISEPFIKQNNAKVMNKLAMLKSDPNYDVRTQLLLSLYNFRNTTQPLVNFILEENKNNEMITGTAEALEKNENIKTYGRRLGSLSSENRELVLKGSVIFRSLCASCHGEGGVGLASKVAPPLIGSKNLNGDKNTAIRIMLDGISGPINDQNYPGGFMPSFGENSDEWIASVLSYARFELQNTMGRRQYGLSPFIGLEDVKLMREKSKNRTQPWTVDELNAELLKEKGENER